MEKLFNLISIVAGIVGGILIKIFGKFDTVFSVLLAMMALDYISGVIKAINKRELSSQIGFKGLLKKVTILVMVAAANIIQKLIGENTAVREMVIMFYIANEGISLLENAAEVSDKVPPKLKDILLKLRGE